MMTELDILNSERKDTGTSWTCNDQFEKDGYFVIKDLWDPEELYYPVPDIRGQLNYNKNQDSDKNSYNHLPVENQVEGSLARYWHPQYRKIHSGVRKKLEKAIGRKLYNTYYYDRFYFAGQELLKHTDRDSCEISVSIHISTNLPDDLKDWPLKIKTPDTYVDKTRRAILVPGEERSAILNPGDGLVYKGCERPHWRDPMLTPAPRKRDWFLKKIGKYNEIEYYYHQIFFHYVLQDGIRSHCAYDRVNT